jgi:hypothetical protein
VAAQRVGVGVCVDDRALGNLQHIIHASGREVGDVYHHTQPLSLAYQRPAKIGQSSGVGHPYPVARQVAVIPGKTQAAHAQ